MVDLKQIRQEMRRVIRSSAAVVAQCCDCCHFFPAEFELPQFFCLWLFFLINSFFVPFIFLCCFVRCEIYYFVYLPMCTISMGLNTCFSCGVATRFPRRYDLDHELGVSWLQWSCHLPLYPVSSLFLILYVFLSISFYLSSVFIEYMLYSLCYCVHYFLFY